ncbi:MAG: hypothetical protein M3Y32_05615 [Pseudomonadota bacterium]|nr:hypothetical protein [Pseudomonadota bacterium]
MNTALTTVRTATHTSTPAPLGAPASARWYALALAATVTWAMLACVDTLAQVESAAPQYAQASSAQA